MGQAIAATEPGGRAAMAASLVVNGRGAQWLVANFEKDSLSVIDRTKRVVVAAIDLWPGEVSLCPDHRLPSINLTDMGW
jgi:hypothetical protein